VLVISRALDPEADRQPVDRAVPHQGVEFAGAFDGEVEPSPHAQAARVFRDRQPAPDRLGGIVLPEHPHAAAPASGEAVREGARRNHILAEVGDPEQARIALEHAVVGHGRGRLGQELYLPRQRFPVMAGRLPRTPIRGVPATSIGGADAFPIGVTGTRPVTTR